MLFMGIFIVLFHFALGDQSRDFVCYKDYSIADRPKDPLQKTSQIFGRKCGCQDGWKDTFCENLGKYSKMKSQHAPQVCICRKIHEKDKNCDQFMTRCFREKNKDDGTCKCCFNQPDNHCDQMDCKNMSPDFGLSSGTSCICHEQKNYPKYICDREDSRGLEKSYTTMDIFPSWRAMDNTGDKKGSESNEKQQDPIFYKAIWEHIRNSKIVFVFALILLIGIIVAICFGCFVICSERAKTSRTNRQKRKGRLETEKRLLEIANHQDPDQYLP